MREILHDEEGLTIAVVFEDDAAFIDIDSGDEGPDLSVPHEVVVVVDGRGRDVDVDGTDYARAQLLEELDEDPQPLTLMVRVHEFFEGWELFHDE